MRANEFGQPIGFPVPNWTPRQRPPRTPMYGRFCRLELVDVDRHAAGLHAVNTDPSAWTYLSYGPFEPFTVYRLPFAVCRLPFTVHRSPFTVCRLPFAVAVLSDSIASGQHKDCFHIPARRRGKRSVSVRIRSFRLMCDADTARVGGNRCDQRQRDNRRLD